MPWHDAHGSPVFLDIRRWIPVGDVLDLGQGHAALPIPPALMPGGPVAVLGELISNHSLFTGKAITLETDTAAEHVTKLVDHLWKAAMPNVLGVPGTYATTGVGDAIHGRTDTFGREMSVTQALLSSFGVKLGSYPLDVAHSNMVAKLHAQIAEIDKEIGAVKRQRKTNRISQEQFEADTKRHEAKKVKLTEEMKAKIQ
jgi:hypothetical protein